MMKYTLFLLLSIGLGQAVSGQANKDSADARYKEAIALMESGKPAAAIPLLEEANKLNPDEWSYDYEIGYAKYMQQDYKAVIDMLKKLTKRKDINSRVYQLLGNAYDMSGKADKANDTYEKGLKVFPDAGNLYLERGVMEMGAKDYNKALGYFERGIQVNPMFASNYYWASRIFLGSDEEVWGMLYGEIFLNLERGSKRTDEISKQLYLTYKGEIQFRDDTSVVISFSKNNVIDVKNIKLPFGVGVYEMTLMLSVAGEKMINMASLNRIRSHFVDNYNGAPLVLIDYEKKVKAAGFLEEYNYWILAEGNDKEFEDWRGDHGKEWEEFIQWFKKNPLVITPENAFYRLKY
jgi:tetratricopeptide (TPR) repeat protein